MCREPIPCPRCGGYAGIRDYLDTEEQIDFDLVRELGIDDDEIREACVTASGRASRVLYVREVAHCDTCQYDFHFVGALRFYWDPEYACFSGGRPAAPKEIARAENAMQEAAGQLRLL